jgi:GDPmannose 4,6-dehydratase
MVRVKMRLVWTRKPKKKTIIAVNSKYYRTTEVETLLGDSSKAKEELGWTPEITFTELVEHMCKNEI